jgi:hypothetical protein
MTTIKEGTMRLAFAFSAGLAVLASMPAFAAEANWFTYGSREDRFALNLPSQPIVEEFVYTSEYGSPWRARRHEAYFDGFIHRMTVVDMSTAHSEQVSAGFEKRGAMVFAAANLRKTGEILLDTYDQVQVIPGHKLEILLPDGRMNLVEIHIYDDLLYIQESISPQDAIPAYDVQSSLELLNADLVVPRYDNAGFPGPIPVGSTAPYAARTFGGGATDYSNTDDRFAIAFSGTPSVESFTYESAQGPPWNARRYSAAANGHTYSVTVVDMTTSRLAPGVDAFRNAARPGSERSGALAYEAWKQRMAGTVEVDSYVERQVIPGIRIAAVREDGSTNRADIYEHNDYLYIVEDLAAPGAAKGIAFHDTLQLLDSDGNVPTYPDDVRTFPDFMEMTGDGTGAAGRDTGAIIRGEIGGP